jgi:hypothetical protein
LVETISSNPTLTSDLVSTAQTAFSRFIEKKLVKCLPSPVDTPSDADGLTIFDAILAKDQADAEWAKSAREREEKFGMYLTSLSRASAAIRTAETQVGSQSSSKAVKELVDGAADVLGPHLGETVSWKMRNIVQKLIISWVTPLLILSRYLGPLLPIGKGNFSKTWTVSTFYAPTQSPECQNTFPKSFLSFRESWTMVSLMREVAASGLMWPSLREQKERASSMSTPSYSPVARATRNCWMKEKVGLAVA